MNERELIENRNQIAQALRSKITDARAEFKAGKRDVDGLNAEEQANYDAMHKDMLALEDKIKSIRGTAEREHALEEHELRLRTEPETAPAAKLRAIEGRQTDMKAWNATPEYRTAFRNWLKTGQMAPELRALAGNTAAAGGATIAAEQFVADLIQDVNNLVFVRQLATIYTLDRAERLTFPTRSADLGAATWGTELQVATADTSLQFGQRALTPHPLTEQILVSKLLFQQSRIDVDALVRERFSYQFAIAMEQAYISGSGADQPLGLFRADPNGISTGRDVITSSSSGNITALNLIATFYSLNPAYRMNASWMFHRDNLRQIRSLQDSNGNFIWTPAGFGIAQGLTVGHPDLLLNKPYYESEYAPNSTASTTGTGTNATGYTTIVGDFKRGYYIADGADLGMNRYDQINAVTNQDTFIGLFQTDGAPVLPNAFARSRLST